MDIPSLPQPLSFTIRYEGRTNTLTTKALVSKPLTPQAVIVPPDIVKGAKEYICIWDTDATHSAISQKVVDECGFKPIGMVEVHSATESKLCETFLVSIFLPNKPPWAKAQGL